MVTWSSALWLAPVLVLSGCATPATDIAWHEVAGGASTLRSCGDPVETRALAADLAEVRASVVALLPEIRAADRVPFSAHIFCRGSDYGELAPNPHQANHFVALLRGDPRVEFTYESQQVATATSARGTRVAVRGAQLRRASDLVRHHYVHHLIRSHVEVPHWIEEGIAGFLGTATRETGGVRRGRASPGMLDPDGLSPVSLGRTFRATDLRTWPAGDIAFFFRGSWLVMHYMHFGNIAKQEPPSARIRRYVAAHASGADEQKATEAAFGKKTTGLRNALDRYLAVHTLLVRNGRLTPVNDVSDGAGLEIRRLPKEAIAYDFGVLALENREGAKAERYFNVALIEAPDDARVQSGRARALALQGRSAEAAVAIARAERLAPDDVRVLLDAAWILIAQQQGGMPASFDAVKALRARASRVVARAPELAEAHYVMGLSYDLPSELDAQVAALERAHAASPGAIEVARRLASALAKAGRVEQARAVATRVAGWVLGERRDREVHAFLDGLPDQRASAVASGPKGS